MIYLFMLDVLLMGAATVLRMLFASGGRDKILARIFWSVGFVILYMGLFAILISYLLININIDAFGDNLGSVKGASWALVFNHVYGFIFGYLVNRLYKSATVFGQMFSTMFYILPMTVILVLFIFPRSLSFGEARQNTWIATAIVNIRFAFDMIFAFLQRKKGRLFY